MPYDDQIVQAKQGQIETLYKAMQRDLVSRLLRRMTAPDVRKAFENPGKNEDGVDAPVYDPNAAQPVNTPAPGRRRPPPTRCAPGVHGTTPDADRLAEHLQRAGNRLAPMYGVRRRAAARHRGRGRAARLARGAGYTERLSMVMDARSDWSSVLAATQSVSLFGDRRILEIKIPTGKPGKAGADTLARLAEQAEGQSDADTLVLISLPRLDKATRESRWVQALARGGMMVDIASIERGRLPAWVGMRLARQNQRADNATLQWMADKVEGNLLAAHQEIQKLGLLYPEGQLAAEDVERAVLNVARYDVFGLRDAMLAGDIARTIRMIDGLRAEGEALPLVLWAVGEKSACSRASPRPARWARTPTA